MEVLQNEVQVMEMSSYEYNWQLASSRSFLSQRHGTGAIRWALLSATAQESVFCGTSFSGCYRADALRPALGCLQVVWSTQFSA